MNLWNFRAALLLMLIFSGFVVLIRAQPYDVPAKRQSIIRDDCTCFAGIQPGVTSVEEAVHLLEASGWAKTIDNRTINNVSGYISWDWSDQKPDWISNEHEGQIWATQKQVVQILIYGNLQVGDTRLIMGLPDQETIDRSIDRKGQYSLYTATYSRQGLRVQAWQPCYVREPLRRDVILSFIVHSDPKLFPPSAALSDLRRTCPFRR